MCIDAKRRVNPLLPLQFTFQELLSSSFIPPPWGLCGFRVPSAGYGRNMGLQPACSLEMRAAVRFLTILSSILEKRKNVSLFMVTLLQVFT